MKTSTLPHGLTALLCGLLSFTSATIHADSVTDDFTSMSETDFKKDWKPGFWAARGAGPTGSATLSAQGITLSAGANVAGAPSEGFALGRLTRLAPFIQAGADMDVTLSIDLEKIDVTPYGTSPAFRLGLALAPEKGKPELTAQIGSVRAQGQLTSSLQIIFEDNDAKHTLIDQALPNVRLRKNSTISFIITPSTIDYTINGESVIGGPQAHDIDFTSKLFEGKLLQPKVLAYKFFGKKSQQAIIQSFTIAGDSVLLGDNDIIGSQLGSTAYLAEPVFTIDTPLTPKTGDSHTITGHFFGLNGNLTSLGSKPWDNEGFANSMKSVIPGHMRYPAGTIANYWDWNIGWIEQEKDSSQFLHWTRKVALQPTRYTLEDFAQGQRDVGFAPVYVMNMVTRDLEDQMKQLHRAKDMGMPITYVELGNEYYFGAGAEPLVFKNFPTPESYAKAANTWAAAIKKDFPEATIAAVGTAGITEGTSQRRQEWNSIVAPMLSDQIDAVTMHPYSGIGMFAGRPNGHWGSEAQQKKQRELLLDSAAVQHAILTPSKKWLQVMAETAEVKQNIWATEFNANDWFGGVRGTWTQSLAVAAAYDGFLRDDRVQLVTLHNAVGGVLFPAVHANTETFAGVLPGPGPQSEAWTPTAVGFASAQYAAVADGRDQAQAIEFGAEAEHTFKGMQQAMPMVRGWLFSDSTGKLSTGGILINYTPAPVTIATKGLGQSFTQAIQSQSSPETYIAQPSDITTNTVAVEGTLTLPAYSFTLLK